MAIKIETHLNNNVLMCVEQLKPVLKRFIKSCIIVLVYKKGSPHCEIIPSLCAYKTEDEKFFPINSIQQLYSITLNIDIEKSVHKEKRKYKSEFDKKAQENNYKTHNFKNECIAIFIKGDSKFNVKKIADLARFSNVVRQRSLNILNDSLNYSLDDWNYLKNDLRPSINTSVKAFKNYLNNRLNLYTSAYIHKEKKWVLYKEVYENLTDQEEGTVESTLLEKDQQLVFSKKLVYGFYENFYYLIIPFSTQRSKKYQKLKIVLFIKNRNPIPYYVAINTTNFIDRFFNEYLTEYKINHLLELQDKINDIYINSNDLHFEFSQDLLNLFSKFTQKALDIVIETTNAFSATCRLFDIKSRTLKRIVCAESNVKRIIDIDRTNEISINDYKSVNVKAWRDANYIYIPDTDKHFSIKHRDNVKSELCIPLFFKGIKIGTINIESPVQDGLRDSINYIQGVAKSISSYYCHLWDLNDKYWICRRSEHEQNTHELLGLVKRKGFCIPDIIKRKIQELISTYTIEISNDKKDLSILESCKQRLIIEMNENSNETESFLIAPFEKGCKININTKQFKIDSYKAGILKIIYSNFLSNFRAHGNLETDSLFINYEGKKRDCITFHMKSKAFLEEDLIRATVSPIPNNDEIKPEKWGLLLTGILVRHLGGFIYLDNIKNSRSIIKAIIPMTNGETT